MSNYRRTRQRTRRQSRKLRGGYSSASTYMETVAGNQEQQYSRTFDQGGPYGAVPGNLLIGAEGQNASMAGMPSSQQLNLIQSAGRRMRHHKGRKSRRSIKRGGLVGEVINQAVVPLTLLGLQQTYKRKSLKNKSRKYRTRN